MSQETKVCLCASITLAHESRHLLEKLSFFFQGGGGWGRREEVEGMVVGGENTLNLHPGINLQNAIQA